MKDEQRPRAGQPADVRPDYRRLPEPVDLDDTIATHETDPPPDPAGGRDPERDFMLRYGAL
jgi:hypothetical protein